MALRLRLGGSWALGSGDAHGVRDRRLRFIGGRLVARLLADGCGVRALARSDASAAAVAELGAEPVRGELGDPDSMAAGAQGCEVRVPSRRASRRLGRLGGLRARQRRGDPQRAGCCARAGVRRFVHCGTEAALMAGEPLVNVDETAPLRPDSPAPYPATKAKAEQEVRAANRDGFETVVLRPRFVWGVGDTTLLPQMVEMVEGHNAVQPIPACTRKAHPKAGNSTTSSPRGPAGASSARTVR